MPVTAVNIKQRQPYAGAQSFGAAGSYQRIDGVLTYAVDPHNPANRNPSPTCNTLRPGPRQIPTPAASAFNPTSPWSRPPTRPPATGGSSSKSSTGAVAVPSPSSTALRRRPSLPPKYQKATAFLLKHGYSVLSIGWQWDVYRSDALLGLDAPEIRIDGQPVTGQACVEMRPNLAETTRLLANREHRPYPVADLNDPDASLRVRDWEDGPDTVIPRSQWHFPDPEHITLQSGFQPGKIYYLIYTATRPVVVGCGLLAIRDAAAWLRKPTDVASGYERIYAHGVSQSGRLLRTMAYLGLNVDESGQTVFDGLLPHVAGGRMGEFNHRFAQPSCQSNPGFGHQFPFADDNLTDTLTEHTDGLLNRLRQLNAVPKIIYTDSAAEYWRGDACLTHVNSAGDADLDAASETRRYLFAGAQHLPGAPDLMAGQGPDGSTGLHPYSSVDYIPLLRAALFNLDRWASDGTEPPPSQHPRLDDGTAVTQAAYLNTLPAVPEQSRPDPARLWRVREIDLGPEGHRGIAAYPVREGREYPHLVPAADADGNDLAGIRLPDLTVPVGTHTGWNLRHPDTGAPEQLMSMQGSTHWFAATEAQRSANSDPRPSLAERYASRDDYATQVKAAARQLADDGYLLAEDVDLVVKSCLQRYDHAVAL